MAAGYKTKKDDARKPASLLLTKIDIQNRIKELKKQTEKKELITRDGLIKEIEDTIKEAKEENQYSVAMKGLELKGKMISAFTDNINNNTTVDGSLDISVTYE